jgi:hypothetical protein
MRVRWRRKSLRFLATKLWFFTTLIVFIVCQQYGILMTNGMGPAAYTLVAGRIFIYSMSMTQLLIKHLRLSLLDYRAKRVVRCGGIPFPQYLTLTLQDASEAILVLSLIVMMCFEPFLYCITLTPGVAYCGPWMQWISDAYDRTSTISMMMYFVLVSELSHFSIQIGAFSLIIMRLSSDFAVYVLAIFFICAAFASSMTCIVAWNLNEDFTNWVVAMKAILRCALGMYGGAKFETVAAANDLFGWMLCFMIVWHMFINNLMIAQLCTCYNTLSDESATFCRCSLRCLGGLSISTTSRT